MLYVFDCSFLFVDRAESERLVLKLNYLSIQSQNFTLPFPSGLHMVNLSRSQAAGNRHGYYFSNTRL